MTKTLKGLSDSLSEIVLTQAQQYIESELDKVLGEILLKAKVKIMQDLVFTIREDQISDRMVMTLEVKKGKE